MTALGKDRKTDQLDTPDTVLPRLAYILAAAATTLYAGSIGCVNASGYAVPGSASNTLRVVGRVEATVKNTVAEGFGSAGDLSVAMRRGAFYFANSTGDDLITFADVQKLCYVVDDQTLGRTDGAGLRPVAGVVFDVRADGQVGVLLGMPSAYDTDDDPVLTNDSFSYVHVRNIINANVADLAAYTVAANASNNDNVLGVKNDVVLLIAQTTASQNGLYKIGTVAAGVAPLTRHRQATGDTILAGQCVAFIQEGAKYLLSEWKNTAGGVVGTADPAYYPRKLIRECVLVAGVLAITDCPILSTTKSSISVTRKTANTCAATVAYVMNGAPTPGALGTCSIPLMAAVAAGTLNNADISTLQVVIENF